LPAAPALAVGRAAGAPPTWLAAARGRNAGGPGATRGSVERVGGSACGEIRLASGAADGSGSLEMSGNALAGATAVADGGSANTT